MGQFRENKHSWGRRVLAQRGCAPTEGGIPRNSAASHLQKSPGTPAIRMPAAPSKAPEKQISGRTKTLPLEDSKRCSSCNTRKPLGDFEGRATCTSCLVRKRRLKKQTPNKLTAENLALKATVEMQAEALSAAERWKTGACNALRVAQQQLQHARLGQMQNCSAPQHFSTTAGFIAPSAAGGSLQQAHPLPMPETGADMYGNRVSSQYLNHPGPVPDNNADSPSSSEVHPQVLHNSNYNSVQQQQELIQTDLKVVVEHDPHTKTAFGKRLMNDSWLPVDGATCNGYVEPQPHKQARIERVNETWSENDLWQLLGRPLEAGNDNRAQPPSHKQARVAQVDDALVGNGLREPLGLPFEMSAFNNLQPHAATSDGTVSAAAGSFMTMSAAQQSDVYMTSIPLHYSAAFADGVQTDELVTSIATFGTGGGTGVQPEPSQIEISAQTHSLYDSIQLCLWRNGWYAVFICTQIHFWYGVRANYWYNVHSWYDVQAPSWRDIYDLGYSVQNNSTLGFEYRAPSFVPLAMADGWWHHQQPLLFKLLLCCVCLLASVYVKRLDYYFPQFCSAFGDESQLCPASKAQRLKQLQQMPVRVLQIFMLALIMLASTHHLMKFGFEYTTFDADLSNCARVAAYTVYVTICSPSFLYWHYDIIRWVVIWTVFPVQIFMYIASGGQYVTMCYTLNLAAKTCSLNIARIHFMGMIFEWSATKYAQEMLWVLAWCILASDLELAPQLIAMTASSCTMVCVKVWVARLYCDATIKSDDKQAEIAV